MEFLTANIRPKERMTAVTPTRNTLLHSQKVTTKSNSKQSRSNTPNYLSTKTYTPTFLKKKNSMDQYHSHVKLEHFDFGEMIGKGGNGSVYLVRHKQTGWFFAMKKYSKRQIQNKINRFISSVKIQMYSDDPNISKIYEILDDKQNIYLIMEYCIDGDLTERVKRVRNNPNAVKNIIIGIVKGLRYLHSMKILHRDLKLENILLCHDMPKITDFDLAVYQSNSSESRRTFCGSPAYFSPQMLTKSTYNSKVDIWCLGILCYELVNGYFPFQINNYSDITNIINQPVKKYNDGVQEDVQNFINMMLIKNPQKRAGWRQILTHPFLQ